MRNAVLFFCFFLFRYSEAQPVVSYTIRVDMNDLSGYNIEMKIKNIPDTFNVGMVAHAEYDDRYWRYIEDFNVTSSKGKGNVQRIDSALWKISGRGEFTLNYRLHLPHQEGMRYAWRPFLSSTGGLLGGPHTFMYIVGATFTPAHIKLELPQGWQTATGLEKTSDPFTFFAPTARILVDAPILIGKFKSWTFFEDNIPHQIAYYLRDQTIIDTSTFINNIQRFVEETKKFFGRLPYREYVFLFQDSAFGALEHLNSVTVGIPATQLAKDVSAPIGTISHEFFHTWNLMLLRPAEYGDVTYKTPPPSRGLWWSEGITLYYSYVLRLRAHLPVPDSLRIKHLEELIKWYFENPGNFKISPEKVSLASNALPGVLGDYTASTHLQGELLGTMLDLKIRNETNNMKSLDNIMQAMMERYSRKGFVNRDIERITSAICNCNVHSFFQDYVYGKKAIDFNNFLQLAGLHYNIIWKKSLGDDGKPAPDTRIYAYQLPGQTVTRVGMTDPLSCWGKAGLHTGDKILTVNGIQVTSAPVFRQFIRNIKYGDTISLSIDQQGKIKEKKILISGREEPVITITEVKGSSNRQKNLLTTWKRGG